MNRMQLIEKCRQTSKPLPEAIERGQESLPCECGGYCDSVDCTEIECLAFGCGRDTPGSECCAAAFVCRICKTRYAGWQPAPDMDYR